MLWRVNVPVCFGSILCGRYVYCVLGRCTVCYGGVLCGMAVYYVLWLRTVCSGGVCVL